MLQRKRRQGNTFDGPEIVGWVQPTAGKAGSDGGLHPPNEEAVTLEHHRGGLPEFEPSSFGAGLLTPPCPRPPGLLPDATVADARPFRVFALSCFS
jgi:hypothetical protein